jgi:hypothetical protein
MDIRQIRRIISSVFVAFVRFEVDNMGADTTPYKQIESTRIRLREMADGVGLQTEQIEGRLAKKSTLEFRW